MKLITRDTDYAVRALRFIAQQKGKIVSVVQLTQRLRIPRPFLRKILQILHNKGILFSFKGQGGGFKLKRKPNAISLAELITIFQGRLKLNECFLKKTICPSIKTCTLKKKMDRIEKYMISQIKSITIASLIIEKKEKSDS